MIKVKIQKTNNWLKDNGYNLEEEQNIFNEQVQDIMDNARWYLDNLDYLNTYRVSWHCYTNSRPGRTRITLPKKEESEKDL